MFAPTIIEVPTYVFYASLFHYYITIFNMTQ